LIFQRFGADFFMKFRLLFPLALLFVAAPLSLHAQSAAQLSAEGHRAYMRRDLATARAKFQQLIEMEPGNLSAQQHLRAIEIVEERSGTGTALAQQLKNVTLPKVELREATFREALDFLKQQAAKQNVKVSFVLQIPEEAERKPVTLGLSNVPFLEALRYLCDANSTQFVVETYAVTIKPAGAAAALGSPAASGTTNP
jgi:hypothetical protein